MLVDAETKLWIKIRLGKFEKQNKNQLYLHYACLSEEVKDSPAAPAVVLMVSGMLKMKTKKRRYSGQD